MSTFDVTSRDARTDCFSIIQGVESTSVVIHMHDMYDTHSDGIAWAIRAEIISACAYNREISLRQSCV